MVVNDAGENVCNLVTAHFDDLNAVYIAHETNQGAGAARNTGLAHAKGKYIAFLDDDDILYTAHLGRLVDFLEANPDHVAAYSVGIITFLKEGAPWHSGIMTYHAPDKQVLLAMNYLPLTTLLYRREAIDRIGPWDAEEWHVEDWDYNIRLFWEGGGKVGWLPDLVTSEQFVNVEGGHRSQTYDWDDAKSTVSKIFQRYAHYATPETRALQEAQVKHMWEAGAPKCASYKEIVPDAVERPT